MRLLVIVLFAGLASCRLFNAPDSHQPDSPDLASDVRDGGGDDVLVDDLGGLDAASPDQDLGRIQPRFVVETEEDFLRGTGFNNVVWATAGLELEMLVGAVSSTGSFVSEVFDGGADVAWGTMAWEPQRPYFFPYPVDSRSETRYPLGNFTSDNLELFARLESPIGTLGDGDAFVGRSARTHTLDVRGTVAIVNSVFGTGVEFTGNGHLEVASDLVLPISPGSGDFTWTAIVFTSECTQPGPVMVMDDLIATGLLIYLGCVPQNLGCTQNDNLGRFVAGVSTGIDQLEIACDPDPPRNVWQHVAIVKRATSFSLFMDGERISQAQLVTSALPFNPDIPLKMGRLDSANSNTSGSVVDEVTVFHRALEDFEVKDQVLRFLLGANIDVRTCDDPLCADAPEWEQDPDVITFADSYEGPKVSLAGLPARRYLQFRVNFASFTSDNSPRVGRIAIEVAP